jgi:hypothetical protein
VPQVSGPLEDDLAEIREQLILGHWFIGDGTRDGLANLFRGPTPPNRLVAEAGEEFLNDVGRTIGECAGSSGIPVEIPDGGRAFKGHTGSLVAASA